jgi:uncharacterized membrane protein YczE
VAQVDLFPVRVSVDPSRRLVQLVLGLVLYGASAAMLTRAGLGLDPWNVLHEGLTKLTGLTFGTIIAISSVGVCCCGSRCGNGWGSALCSTS